MPVSYEHHNGDDDHGADGDPHSIAADLSHLCPAQVVIADLREPGDPIVDRIVNVVRISARGPDIRLDGEQTIHPVEAQTRQPIALQRRAPGSTYQVLGR